MNIQTLIYIIFAGIGFALIYTYYTKKFLGSLVRRLHEKKINNDEASQTLEQLGYGKISAFLLNVSLGKSSSLMKYLKGHYTEDQLIVLKDKNIHQRYYLPEENSEIALKRYDSGDVKLWKVFCGIIACVVAAVICAHVFPKLVSMTENRFTDSDNKNEPVGTRIEETITNVEEPVTKTKEDK